MRPHVVLHIAVSVDGRTGGFAPDVGRFYALAQTWNERVTLAGADTILAQEQALTAATGPGPAGDGPLLAVVDARARVRQWDALRDAGHWSDVVALRSAASHGDTNSGGDGHVDGNDSRDDGVRNRRVRTIVTDGERVDLRAALAALADLADATAGAAAEDRCVVRVDSGGRLNGALLRDGLVDEISLLVHPVLAGEHQPAWHGDAAPPAGRLERIASEPLDGGLDWLRYRVVASA